MSDIEQRLRRVEDRIELRDLVARYCLATDDRDYDTLAEVYAADAVYTGPSGRCEGRDAVIAYVRQAMDGYGGSVHTAHHQLVDFDDDDHATGVVTAHVEMGIGDETRFGAMRYRDRYARIDGRWRIAERTLDFVHIGPWSQVAQSLTTQGSTA